jgi:hypothetical protein
MGSTGALRELEQIADAEVVGVLGLPSFLVALLELG